jgi:hypothetical protein
VADSDALRTRRSRAHQAGIHELCVPGRCPHAGTTPELAAEAEGIARLREAVLLEFPESDPLSRAMALRLVDLAAGRGPAAVNAIRNLGELTAWQRGDP